MINQARLSAAIVLSAFAAVSFPQDAGSDTDFYAIRNNKVSITPLQVDLTRYSVVDDLKNWAEVITKDEI